METVAVVLHANEGETGKKKEKKKKKPDRLLWTLTLSPPQRIKCPG